MERLAAGRVVIEVEDITAQVGALPPRQPDPSEPTIAPPQRLVEHVTDMIRADWGQPLPPVMTTGITELDDGLDGGFEAESVAVIAGRTGGGKSGLMGQIGLHIARTHPVLAIASELSRRQTLARYLAQVMNWNWRDVYKLGPEELDRLVAAAGPLDKLTVVYVTRGQTIRGIVEAYQQETGQTPVILVDYLQHCARRLAVEDPRMAVSAMSQEITDLARELRTVVLVISSVSRAVAKEDTSAKMAIDFVTSGAESGAIEFDAGAVLYLETDPCPPGGTAEARLHIAKNRFGAGNRTIGLAFQGARGVFTPDPAAALSQPMREVLVSVLELSKAKGQTTTRAVRERVGGKAQAIGAMIGKLIKIGLVRKGRGGKGLHLTPSGFDTAQRFAAAMPEVPSDGGDE